MHNGRSPGDLALDQFGIGFELMSFASQDGRLYGSGEGPPPTWWGNSAKIG
jgi:hypothetical protein